MSHRPLSSIGIVLAAILSSAPATGRADVLDVRSTTILSSRVDARDGQSYRLVPAYELVSLTARDIRNPVAEDLQLVLSAWGELDMGPNLRWDNRNLKGSRLGGDLDVAYVQGDVLKRSLQIRLGRQLVAGGVARVVQLDGAQVVIRPPLQVPVDLGLSAYVGSPVSARFSGWNGETTLSPARGNLAAGGRFFAILPRYGELGVSLALERDHGDPSRKDLGADLKVFPARWLTFLASTLYPLGEGRLGELDLSATAQPTQKLQVTVDYRHTEPDLLLARDSILSVFAADHRNEVGAIVSAGPFADVTMEADYHYLAEDAGRHGHRGRLRGTWRILRATTAGGEVMLLNQPDNTYVGGRLFASHVQGRLSFTADIQDYKLREEVNGRANSFLATLSAGYRIARDLSALLAATAGNTPLLSSRLDVMAKLVYSPSFHVREVR
jgi:hypothetical protein